MKTAFLHTRDDMKWLKDVHEITARYAVVEGNEDCPSKVFVYTANNIDALSRVYVQNGKGRLKLEWKKGDAAPPPK